MVDRWQRIHDVASVVMALTASGSAVAGWTLWQMTEYRTLWAWIAGVGAVVAIIHGSLGVPGRLKDWGESKRAFAGLEVGLQTLQLEMKIDDDFSTGTFTSKLMRFREELKNAMLGLKNDMFCTSGLQRRCQGELNARLDVR